ncbi:unnamed protein product [Rotaria socialis]|uniref:NmrA-like family domain-containing protein 1 n=2 Tax=Rotaria TaxID=231623 RepID=A0A820YLJ7_9BILA|nr:unnamed protein product [Rotaria socialis]CAF4106946.1 unnamed protein product [Rotaria magnacalcarata]CAF4523686.1 unnamed protein product [Rotaria socialis]CAF4529660.1 unnamed protein product [Rotaria socialis]CAF4544661.1 unnamed protein product [Rotaria socialis]
MKTLFELKQLIDIITVESYNSHAGYFVTIILLLQKIRGLTRDAASEKAQAVKRLNDHIEMVSCDINKREDVERAFKDSWAIFALTDFSSQISQPGAEIQQGKGMADAAAALQIPYFIFSTLEDATKLSGGKYVAPHFAEKAKVRDYIKEYHPTLKTIYVEPAFYMQNWSNIFKPQKSADGAMIFALPIDEKTTLHMVDIEDTGPIVCKILNDPDKYVGQDICICGEAIQFSDIPKVFTKVTGIPALAKTLTEEEYRSAIQFLPKFVQDELFAMFQWFQEYGYYGKDKDWTTGQKLTALNTFEQWLKKTGWKGQ